MKIKQGLKFKGVGMAGTAEVKYIKDGVVYASHNSSQHLTTYCIADVHDMFDKGLFYLDDSDKIKYLDAMILGFSLGFAVAMVGSILFL